MVREATLNRVPLDWEYPLLDAYDHHFRKFTLEPVPHYNGFEGKWVDPPYFAKHLAKILKLNKDKGAGIIFVVPDLAHISHYEKAINYLLSYAKVDEHTNASSTLRAFSSYENNSVGILVLTKAIALDSWVTYRPTKFVACTPLNMLEWMCLLQHFRTSERLVK